MIGNIIYPVTIDGIERPCKNCNTVNIHTANPWGNDCPDYQPQLIESTTPAFDAMLATARALGLPKIYTCDLFRDYQLLTGRNREMETPNTFLWGASTCGTDIIRLEALVGKKNEAGPRYWFDLYRNRRNHWYYWDGRRFTSCSLDRAQAIAYEADIRLRTSTRVLELVAA